LSYIGAITGGCLNPAVGVGLIVIPKIFEDSKYYNNIENCGMNGFWIVLVGPLLGGILAGVFYMLMHRP